MYRVAPTSAITSAITHYGEVELIEPVALKGEPVALDHPIPLGKNPNLKPQGARYASLAEILKARTVDDTLGR